MWLTFCVPSFVKRTQLRTWTGRFEHYALFINNLVKSKLPANHMHFAMLQNGMGQAMLQRYSHWGSQDDLAFAIDSFRK